MIEQISDIILTFDKMFDEVCFGIEEIILPKGTIQYCIFVDDFEFYMHDPKFKKWKTIFRKKYPKLNWYCAYKHTF